MMTFGDFSWSFTLFALGAFLVCAAVCRVYDSYKKGMREDFEQSFLLSSTEINTIQISNMLDNIIAETISDYMLLNVPLKDLEYANAEKEQEILLDVSNLVMARMTPAVISRLSLIYNINSDQDLSDIIANKVYIEVINIVVDHNRTDSDIETNKKENPPTA